MLNFAHSGGEYSGKPASSGQHAEGGEKWLIVKGKENQYIRVFLI